MLKTLRKFSILSLYFFSSVFTTILNKVIVSTYSFQMHYMLVLLQSALIVLMLLGYYSARMKGPSFYGVGRWYVTSFFLTVMIFSGMKAVFYLPVSVFTLFKNLSIIPTAIIEHRLFVHRITPRAMIAFVVIAASSYTVQILDDINITGYLWMLMNIVSTTAYMLYLKCIMDSNTAAKVDSVFFTNLLSLPLLALLSYTFDPLGFMTDNYVLWSLILLSSVCAFLTAFSTAWTLTAVSSTAVSVMGALNKLVLSAGSIIVFNEPTSILKLSSLFIGILAATLYSVDTVRSIQPLPIDIETTQ